MSKGTGLVDSLSEPEKFLAKFLIWYWPVNVNDAREIREVVDTVQEYMRENV